MNTSRLASFLLTAIVSTAAAATVMVTGSIALAQADSGAHLGPPRSPDVVIEQPRPPRPVIETEGRGEPQKCRSANAADLRDAIQGPGIERECEEH